MCGIVGLIAKTQNISLPYYSDNLFTWMLRCDTIRGLDSTGVFGVAESGQLDYLKADTNAFIFTMSQQYGDFIRRYKNYKFIVGHNRKATSGSISAANAHPFQERHIILVHNGTLFNAKTLAETEVDSHAIAHALADHDTVTALGKISGAYALVWYDQNDKTLNLARNKDRPLYLVEYDDYWAIASEPGLPMWLNSRDQRKSMKVVVVPTEKILVFSLNDLQKGFCEVPYDEYKSWKTPTNYPITSSGFGMWKPVNQVHTLPQTETSLSFKTRELLTAGKDIAFKLEDSKPENGIEILIGHPLFDNYVDENILVRAVLKRGEDPFKYFDDHLKGDFWMGKIQHFRNMAGIPTVFVTGISKLAFVQDCNGAVNHKLDLERALLEYPCRKCFKKITIDQVSGGIARRNKTDNTWRIICPSCLKLTIEEHQIPNRLVESEQGSLIVH